MKNPNRKRRIAFVLTSFVVGGVEKSFLSLLDHIDRDRYDVTVYLPDNHGEWTPLLEEKCNVQYLRIESFRALIHSHLRQKHFGEMLRCAFYRILARIHYKKAYWKSTEYFIRSMPRIKEQYDCAVAYQIINDDCVLSTLYRLNARKKIVWSHAYIHKEEPIYGDWYNRFDKIFCVSKFAQNALTDNFPLLADKTDVLYNIIDDKQVKDLSNEPIDLTPPQNATIIATIGRLSQEKGQQMIPEIIRLLLNRGHKIAWYLIGDGDLKADIQQKIEEFEVADSVFLLGNKDNPYPYVKACDIYVQTSLVEGWGLTVTEAKILAKPIVTTDAGVMSEQIQTGINGIVVQEDTPQAIAAAIGRLIDDPALQEQFSKHLQQEDICHKEEIKKLYAVIEQ